MTQGISTHWIRHDPDVGRAELRLRRGPCLRRAHHSGSETGATATYVRASLAEVAAALAALTGESHPLAVAEGW